MKNQYLFLLIILVSYPFIVNSQNTNIMISDSNLPEEPTIFINPKNTNYLIAGANINNYYYSEDGGLSWNKGILHSDSCGVWGDPCVVIDTSENYYFFHLSNPALGNWIDRIVCQKSTDNGQTWSDGTYMGLNGTKAQDKEWAVVDRTNNNIYVCWTQFDKYGSSNSNDSSNILFSKSTDQGETWSNPIRINKQAGDCFDSDNTVEGAVPTVGPQGEIYVSWAGPLGIMFDKSTDQGDTWLDDDVFVSNIPGGWDFNIPGIYRCNGLPITACDISNGPYRGNIYINWSDQRNGITDTDVWLVKSTDKGQTWTEPRRVNDDAPGKQQFFTWMTIDQTNGYLYFIFYDRRNYDDNNTDVYMAVSKDGGETFTNVKVSESPFMPYSNVFFGDYNNITAYNNVIRPIWTRLNDCSLSVYTAIVDTNLVEVRNLQQIPFSLEQNYPNPFKESTYFSFKLHKPSRISLKIFDLYGRLIATIINNKLMNSGKYLEHFNANKHSLSSGIYYFSLVSNNQAVKRKMIFQK